MVYPATIAGVTSNVTKVQNNSSKMSKFQPQQVKQISYLQDFKCAAASCVDSCCVGWIVGVSQDNKKFYEEQNSEILQYVEPQNDKEFQMLRCDDGSCSQLENNLCSVQKNFGEAYLPDICYTFPRSYKKISGEVYMAANLACPESLKVALFNNKVGDFSKWDEVEQSRPKAGLYNYSGEKSVVLKGDNVVNIFSAIVEMIDEESCNSDYAMSKLLLLTRQMDQKDDFDWLNLKSEIAQISKDKIAKIAAENFAKVTVQNDLFGLLKAIFVLTKIDRPRYNKVVAVIKECGGDYELSEEDFLKNYEMILKSWNNSQNNFDQILKNFIKAKLSYRTFLIGLENKQQNITAFALEYLVIKMALMCFNHKLQRKMTAEEIIDVIQPLTKRFYGLKNDKLQNFCIDLQWQDCGKLIAVLLNFSQDRKSKFSQLISKISSKF